MLKAGDSVPAFSLESQTGNVISDKDLRGKRYVIYFYPKDDTPGCTKEACSFRDHLETFNQIKVPVFGVNADDNKSHFRFARKYDLNFELLSDPEHSLLVPFGTWVEKTMYGRTYFGVARSTFVVNAKGIIEKCWPHVSPENHAEEVLAYLTAGKQLVSKKKSASKGSKASPAKKTAVVKKSNVSKKITKTTTTKEKQKAAVKKAAVKKVAIKKLATKKVMPTKVAGKTKTKPILKKPTLTKKSVAVKKTSKAVKKATSITKKAAPKHVPKKSTKKAVPVKKSTSSKKVAPKAAAKKSVAKKITVKKQSLKKPVKKQLKPVTKKGKR